MAAGKELYRNGKHIFQDRPLQLKGATWVEHAGSTALLDDFISPLTAAVSSNVGSTVHCAINQSGTPSTDANISGSAGGAAGQAGIGGWLAGSVDNVDAEIDEIALGFKPWLMASRQASGIPMVMEAGFVIPTALTARQYFVGFSDDESEGTTTNGALNIQSGLTTVDPADDAVGFIFSSLATAPTVWKYSNTKAGTQATNATTAGLTATVDLYTKFRVEVDAAGVAYLYGGINAATTGGRNATEAAWIATVVDAVTATAPLIPIFTAAATTTTAVEWEIDYLYGAGRA